MLTTAMEIVMNAWNPFTRGNAEAQPGAQNLAQELAAEASALLLDWAGMRAEPQGRPSKRPQPGMLCLAVKVDGQAGALVAVAATHRLGADLAVAATGDPGAASFSGEALRELCTLLRERLSLSQGAQAPLTLIPEPLDDGQWPGHAPQAELSLLVNGHPLEIRLWHP